MSARGLRAIVAVGAVLGLLLPASLTQAAKGPACPTFSPSNFSKPTRVTNSYFPLRPGDLYTYKGNRKRVPVVDTVYVTTNPRTIDGVNVVEVRDQVSEGGIPTEDTLDWYAQDNQGNVWYFGEYTTQLPAGTHTGSWTAGVDGARPGYIMEAAPPTVGDTYCQENAPGIAEDAGQVVSITTSRSVPYNSYSGNVVQTKDYSLIEPHSEYKFYGPGVGLLEAIALNGGNEDLQLYSLEHNQ